MVQDFTKQFCEQKTELFPYSAHFGQQRDEPLKLPQPSQETTPPTTPTADFDDDGAAP